MPQADSPRSHKVPAKGPGRWAAFAEVAQGLPTPDDQTEIHGTVIHRDSLFPLAMACTMACGFTVLGVFLPRLGLALLTAVTLGVLLDAWGGNSWVRRLTPLTIGRTVLSWPRGGNELHDERPVILICLESGRPLGTSHQLMLGFTLTSLFLALTGTTIHALNPDIPLPTQRWGAAALAAGPVLASVLSPIAQRHCWLQSSAKVAHALCGSLQALPERTHRIAIALVDQSPLSGDGLRALLQAHHHRLPKLSTTVVCWSRGGDDFAWIRPRTLQAIGPLRPDSGIAGLDIPSQRGTTTAGIALRTGRKAYGLAGGESPAQVSDQLMQIVRAIETRGRLQ
jgi:hypothetical protein